jgi:hypothetical protein
MIEMQKYSLIYGKQAILVLIFIQFFNVDLMAQAKTGCTSGTCANGKGTYVYPNGGKYMGDWLNKLPHGRGVFTSREGNVYFGEWVKGVKNGKGKMTFISGDTYTGEYNNDIINGRGKMVYRNKDVYDGDWFAGRAHGKGTYVFADGDTYVGEFLAGEFSGNGKLSRKDGSTYVGTWLNNKKHGEGVSTSQNGKTTRQQYDKNKLIAETASVQSAPTAQGHVKDCTDQYCDGIIGKYSYGDGSVFEGDFVKGEPEGLGTCYYVNGDRYEGGWKAHSPHGKGVMYFANGNTYASMWELGAPTKQLFDEPIKTNPKPTSTKKTDNGDVGETKIYALIVGIASYNHLQSLKYTDDDAYQLFAFLKSPEGGAIPDPQIKILIDDAATKSAITSELQRFSDMADANDVIILYTSGHGLDGSFVPSDFNGYQNHLPYDDVLSILNGSSAKHKLFIADACHSGSMSVAARSPFNISLQNFYNAYNTLQGGTAILMSSKKEEVSLEYGGLRQGVFSHFLIKGLKGEADTNNDKLIDITELHHYVNLQVQQYTNNAQNPQIMGDFDKRMPVGMVR